MNPDVDAGRRRERIIGGVVVAVGLVVAVLSVIALLAAGDGPASDVAGPRVTLPASASANPTASASGSPSASATAPTGAPATPTTAANSTATTAAPGGGAGSQPLVVLNNTTDAGLAAQAAQQFQAGGWTVSSTGNFSGDILSTCAYYDPTVPGAQQAAEALQQQFPAIQRTKERFGGLPAGPVVVVLTSDYTAQ